MLKEILWLLAGYLAIIGLVRVVAVLVDLIAPPKAPQGCRLYLRVPEDADYTESSLIGCCRLLHRGETGAALHRAAAAGAGGTGDLPAVLPGPEY